MLGLTKEGLMARILANKLELTEKEAIHLWFLFPLRTDLTWDDGIVTKAKVKGLNLEFSITS